MLFCFCSLNSKGGGDTTPGRIYRKLSRQVLMVALAVSLVGIRSLWLKQEAQGCSQPHPPMACLTPSFPPMWCCVLGRGRRRGAVHAPSTEGRVEDWFIGRNRWILKAPSPWVFPSQSLPDTESVFRAQRPLSIICCRCHVGDPRKGTEGRKGLEMPTPHIWLLGPLILSPGKDIGKEKHFLFILQAAVTSNNKVCECQLPIISCPFQLRKTWHSGWHCTYY